MKKLLLFVLTSSMFIFADANADNYLYVVNSLAQTLSKINLDEGIVDNHILTLQVVPNDIKVYRDSAYILHSISDNIQIYDLVSELAVGTVEFARGGNPWEMAFGGNGYAYVTNFESGEVYEVDIAGGQISREFSVGNTLEAVFVSSGKLFVSDVNYEPGNYTFGDGKLYYADLPDLSYWSDLTVGTNPQKIIIGPDGNIHVICTGNYDDISGSIYVIDPENPAIVDSINIGGSPGFAKATSGGLIMLGAGGWAGNGEVYCYDGNTYDILNGPLNPIPTGIGAMGIASDFEGFAYSCNFIAGSISKIDQSRQVVDTYLVGDGPQVAAFYNPDLTGIEDPFLPVRTEIIIEAYPNPFNNRLTVLINGAASCEIENVRIYNLNGALVWESPPQQLQRKFRVSWNTQNLSSGIYFLNAKYPGGVLSKKVTLLK